MTHDWLLCYNLYMFEVTLPAAFLAGLITFLAPCTLPLVPAYIAFLAGHSKKEESILVKRALSFVAGFSLVVVALGVFVSSLGRFVMTYRSILVAIGGALFILFGISLLGFIKIPAVSQNISPKLRPNSNFGAFLFGVIFAFGWSPCVGPILGSIYILAAQSESSLKGTMLLVAYAIGHGLPFVLFAYFYDKSARAINFLSKYTDKINKGAGVILVVIGLFMLLGKYAVFLDLFRHILNGGWQNSLMNLM